MKKRGFTLVELLAVIVILAIVAIIAVPIILNVIKDAREKSIVNSISGLNDAVEKAIATAAMEDKTITEGLTASTEEGCYKIDEELYKKVKVKGEKPSEGEICIDKKGVNKITGAKINGESNVSYIGTKGKVKIGNRVIGTIAKAPSELKGIAKQDYNVGDTISYLGYNWKVMRDNGSNVQLVMDGYLSSAELKANLPSNVASSNVSSNGDMSVCLVASGYYGDSDYNKFRESFVQKAGIYCYTIFNGASDEFREYTWKTSIIKPTIENWLENKMEEKGLTKEKELVGMAFSDGVENNTGYIRLLLREEVSIEDGTDDCKYAGYCSVLDSIGKRNYNYLMTTKVLGWQTCVYSVLSGTSKTSYACGYVGEKVVPVITVNEK